MDPERLGRFLVEGKLGSGGMGSVFAARDTGTGLRAAVKVLSGSFLEDPEKFRRFEQEVVALSRLDHPNVVRLLGPLERDGTMVFFPMELLEGETLAAKLRREGPLPVPVAMSIARSLLLALGAAHTAGVIHRDVKPSNVILTVNGPKVTDFGLARMEDLSRLTTTGQLMGTLDYMAPEQCEGRKVDPRADLYSFGCVLFEMLAGRPPFRRESPGATLKGHLQDAPPSVDSIRSDLPAGLADVVGKLLAKKPEERYGDTATAFTALDLVRDPAITVTFHPGQGPLTDAALTVMPMPEPPPGTRRRKVLFAAAAAVILLAAAGVALLLLPPPSPSPAPPPAVAARGSPEEVLATIHRALKERNYTLFADCFEESALAAFLSEEPEQDFAARTVGIADFAYRLEIPLRGASVGDLSMRVGSSAALAKVLGLSPGAMLRIALRHHEDGFAVAFAGEEGRPGTLSSRPEPERRMLTARLGELFKNVDELAPLLIPMLSRESGLPPEELRRRLREAQARGGIDLKILEEESMIEGSRATIVVKSAGLAKVMSLPDDRLVFELQRRLRERKWSIRDVRAYGK